MMHGAIRQRMIEVARCRRVATYTDIAPLAGLDMGRAHDRQVISDILCEISTAEHEAGRPLLSAVIVGAEDGKPGALPGKGFFTMAARLGFDTSDPVVFFTSELTRVHAYWTAK